MKSSAQPSVVIIGNGGHARVLLEILQLNNYKIIGLSTDSGRMVAHDYGYELFTDEQVMREFLVTDTYLVNGIGTTPYSESRSKQAFYFREKGFQFSTIVHPNALLAKNVELAEGVQVMSGVVLQPGITIDTDSIINTRVSVDHDCRIGANCHLSPGVILCGDVTVGNSVFIGAGSVITPGTKIGDNAIIGAGSVVLHDIAPGKKFLQKK